jgi:hypothetical protein
MLSFLKDETPVFSTGDINQIFPLWHTNDDSIILDFSKAFDRVPYKTGADFYAKKSIFFQLRREARKFLGYFV